MFSHEKPSAEQGIEPKTSHTVVFRAIDCATSTSSHPHPHLHPHPHPHPHPQYFEKTMIKMRVAMRHLN